jgi:2-dehydro-3-deoxygluconokinase
MSKVLCFGEILLRLSPDILGAWIKESSMPVYIGGAELNVAQALARWNIPSAYCSAMPDNYLTKEIKEHLREKNIDVRRMIVSGNRLGTYYLAQGTDLKHAEVIYDRAGSSTAMLKPGTLDWNAILKDVSWFHFSAISPAIGPNLAEVCMEALQAASRKNIRISVDLNYRAKLWKWGKEPVEVMPDLVSHCDLVMGNIWAAEMMLGVTIDKTFQKTKELCIEQALKTSEQITRDFRNCSEVANTFRFDQENDIMYYGTIYSDRQLFVSPEHRVQNIVDKVGSGDCFMAGLIYGNWNRLAPQETIGFAAAAAVSKMHVKGDATTVSVEEIRNMQEKADGSK